MTLMLVCYLRFTTRPTINAASMVEQEAAA